MNQQCKVCGEPAAGFHFGAFTCEGCKSFFGRTYNNIGSVTECKNNGECIINKKNRTACKACRLRKCLLVGMSKSGSRYGRRSNWFKIHCLLQEQQQAVGTGTKEKSALALWGENYKNLPMSHHFEESKKSPSDDNVNNNSSKDSDIRSPNHLIPPSPYSAEAAAALWAARNSFIPMQLPPHHLQMPFLASPFGSFPPPHPTRNFLLPFMQSMHSPNQNATNTISSSPSRSSPDMTPSPRSSPSRTHRIHTPLSESSEKQRLIENQNKIEERLTERKNCEESSIAMLRALGPVQEHPIDLSLKEPMRIRVRTRTKSDESDESEDQDSITSDSSDKKDENFNQRKRPLDLTKTSQIES